MTGEGEPSKYGPYTRLELNQAALDYLSALIGETGITPPTYWTADDILDRFWERNVTPPGGLDDYLDATAQLIGAMTEIITTLMLMRYEERGIPPAQTLIDTHNKVIRTYQK